MADIEVSQYVISAICGCWWQESGINPAVWENFQVGDWHDLGVGYGLGQWTNTGGDPNGRLWKLYDYMTSNGYAVDDGYGQLEYLIEENYWTPKDASKYHYQTLEEFLTSTSQNLDYLVWDFLACWEGRTGNKYVERCRYARNVFNYITLHRNDQTTWEWIKGNRYLSESERYNNAMVVFNNIGKWRPAKPRKMPLWMMCNRNKNMFVLY